MTTAKNTTQAHGMNTHIKTAVLSLLLLGMLSACSSNTTVSLKQDKAFPIPLVEAYPLNIGKHYTEEFVNYAYIAEVKRDNKVVSRTEVALGQPQINLFDSVLDGMFTTVTPIDAIAPGSIPTTMDVVIVPAIVDFQYANPRVTRQNVYEIWIKYRIRMLTPDGTKVADFTLPAYGKTPSAFMKSASDAINAAALVALRDLGASLITRFEREADVAAWLQEKNLLSAEEE